MRARIGCLAAVSLVAGVLLIWSMWYGYIRLPDAALNDGVFAIAGVLVLVGGAYLILEGAWSWFEEHFPSKERRAKVAEQAGRLGLWPVDDPSASIDRSFPLLGATRGAGGWSAVAKLVLSLALFTAWLLIALISGLTAAVGALEPWTFALILVGSGVVFLGPAAILGGRTWFQARRGKGEKLGRFTTGALRPGRGRIKRLFAGRWSELDVRVFDYEYGDDPVTEWTCALLPLGARVPDLEVRRESVTTRLGRLIGRQDLALDEPAFDEAFHVVADREDEARRVLSARVRTRLVADAPTGPCVLQLHEREMLFCVSRIDIDSRGVLLDAARRLRDALEPG